MLGFEILGLIFQQVDFCYYYNSDRLNFEIVQENFQKSV